MIAAACRGVRGGVVPAAELALHLLLAVLVVKRRASFSFDVGFGGLSESAQAGEARGSLRRCLLRHGLGHNCLRAAF